MAQTKPCPNCGASNPETAQWCSLCLERFVEPEEQLGEPEPAQGEELVPVTTAPEDVTGVAEGAEGAEGAEPAAATRTTGSSGAFTITEGGITWTCATCGSDNALEQSACSVCGATFADTVRPREERPPRDPSKAALYSLFFPGAGHAYVGMWGQAVARGVLSAWVFLVALIGLLDRDVPGSLIMAAMFGLAALGLWAAAAHDAYREAANESNLVLLRGRRFLYVVLGLMALLFVVMFIAMLSARSRTEDPLAAPTSIPAWRSTSSPTSTAPPTI